jgi:hypothetical protein
MSKRAKYQIVFLILGCTIGLASAELLLRISNVWIGRHSDTMFTIMEHDDLLGWKMKPNIVDAIDVVDVEGVPIRSNSAGFWDDEYMEQKPSGTCRIAFLGDSMTWGMGVREEQRFSDILGAENPDWDVQNFGMGGFGTDQALLVWRHLAREYRPDVVVLTLHPNDYLDNVSDVRWGRRKPYFELYAGSNGSGVELRGTPVDPKVFWEDGVFQRAAPPYADYGRSKGRSRVAHFLIKYSDLVRALYTTLRAIRPVARTELTAEHSEQRQRQDSKQIEVLGALIAQMHAEVEATGARFLVTFSGSPDPKYQVQMKQLERQGIPYVNATAPLDEDLESGENAVGGAFGSEVYHPYNNHWNVEGHRAVASLLAREFRQRALCSAGT